VTGRDVWLLHPWALGDPPADLPDGALVLGLLVADFHQAWPWSDARWAFVGERMAALSTRCWWGAAPAIAEALGAARSVQTLANPHIDPWLPANVLRRASPQLFAQIDPCCHSFSQWWTRVMRGVHHCQDLPGWTAAPALHPLAHNTENPP
jgi:deoxyribodipyrimidine photo-lyase